MICDICGKEKDIWGHTVCADCYCKTKKDQIQILKHQLAEKDYALMLMAKQLCLVYDDESCSYGDNIAGYDAEETAINYLNYAKKLLDQIKQGESK